MLVAQHSVFSHFGNYHDKWTSKKENRENEEKFLMINSEQVRIFQFFTL